MDLQLFYSSKSTLKGVPSPKARLGGKGAGLAEMVDLGITVPPFVVIPTYYSIQYLDGSALKVMGALEAELPKIKAHFVEHFGYMPLLSIRSGAKVSMPGMMDTILNVGLDVDTLEEWEKRIGESCAWDSFYRLIQMFGNVVHGVPREKLLPGEGEEYQLDLMYDRYKDHTGVEFPTAEQQIIEAVQAVFKSWNNDRAKTYRKLNNIPDSWGTGVVLQAMVFGNYNEKSATGVLFTRDPSTGSKSITGEYLVNAQGEDVVAGIRTPEPLSNMSAWNPDVLNKLMDTVLFLEKHYKDMQDVEFTIQDGQLYILQTRTGKRTAQAALRIAMDLYCDQVIPLEAALKKVTLKQWYSMLKPVIDPAFATPPSGVGIPASSGIASGIVVLTAQDAVNSKHPCILVSHETTPEDVAGMNAAKGILTAIGGLTSHGAVVARSLDTPAVVGCTDLKKDPNGIWFLNGKPLVNGTPITIDGSTGNVWVDIDVPVVSAKENELVSSFETLMGLASNCGELIYDPQSAPHIPDDAWVIAQTVKDLQFLTPSFTGYLDIRPLHHTMPESFSGVLSALMPTISDVRQEQVYVLTELMGKGELKCKVVTGDPKLDAKLKEAGIVTVPHVIQWMDLLDIGADGGALLGPKVLSEAYATKVLELRKLAGLPLSSLSVGKVSPAVDRAFLSENQKVRALLG